MQVVCIDFDVKGMTLGKYYDVIKEGPNPDGSHPNHIEWFLLVNDFGKEKWYCRCFGCVIKILITTNTWIEWIGTKSNSLTIGKWYQVLEMVNDEYYYFMDDTNTFVGVRRISYIGGENNFRIVDIEDIRDKKLDQIGI